MDALIYIVGLVAVVVAAFLWIGGADEGKW